MTSKELNTKLIKFIPEIEDLYKEEVSWQEGDNTGSHIVFGDVLFPYILDNVENENHSVINKIFSAIEKILELNDEYSEEVVALSVLENLYYEDNIIIEKLFPIMGEKTTKLFFQIQNT